MDEATTPVSQPRGRAWMSIARASALLPGPAAVAWCVFVEANNLGWLFAKERAERGALAIASVTVAVAAIGWLLRRGELNAILFAAAAAVLLREIHWEWTTWFIYVAIALLGVTAHLRRDVLRPVLRQRPVLCTWIIATAATYLLSQMIARRFFQHVAGDDSTLTALLDTRWYGMRFYGQIEEIVEVAGHLMMLVTVWMAATPMRSTDEHPTGPSGGAGSDTAG